MRRLLRPADARLSRAPRPRLRLSMSRRMLKATLAVDPKLRDLKTRIDQCMLSKRRQLWRQAAQLAKRSRRYDSLEAASHELAELERQIEASIQQTQARMQAAPRPTFPEALPVSARREEIAKALTEHQVLIVCGETGSGKSTQLPKLCLSLGRGITGMIGHTQPRRIAARTLAARIASELGTELGQAVGYKVRFTDRLSPT